MTLLPRTPNLRPLAVAAAVLAAVALAPGRAFAECGDYVHIASDPAAEKTDTGAGHGDPSAPRPPCHGPNCSSHPDTPLLPLAPPVSEPTSPKECAVRGAADAAPAGGPGWLLVADAAGSPVSRPDPVFHPPRV